MTGYWLVAAIIGYLLGSLPTGYLMGRLYGLDIRQYGSGATGGTNVLRTVGRIPAAVTAVVDVLKGTLAVWIAMRYLGGGWGLAIAGIGALIGHSYPVWLRFRGGKSVATGAGVVLPFAWLPVLIGLGVFVLVVAATRYVSLGSILATLTVGVIVVLSPVQTPAGKVLILAALLVIIWRHRTNLQRLLQGEENKLGQKAKSRETS